MRRAVILALALLGGCGAGGDDPALLREADRSEAAIGESNALHEKYGTADESYLSDRHPGRGQLAGMAVVCGRALGFRKLRDGAAPRVIEVGHNATSEADVGQDPAVFEILWKRAGC